MGAIKQYANNVFTNEGQTDVPGILPKLLAAKDALNAVDGLKVYVGYHGDVSGNFDRAFTDAEMDQVNEMKESLFPKAVLIVQKAEMASDAIQAEIASGNVFFTWCDSDTRVNSIMGAAMPALVG